MNRILNAAKEKFNNIKKSFSLRALLVSLIVLAPVVSVTLAWYINNLGMWGIEFNTGNINFNTYVYSEDGALLVGPVSSNEENESKYINAPLITLENGQVGSTGTAYVVVESTGSLGIQYRIAFDITGRNETSTAYLGGYKYNVSKVTDKVDFTGADNMDVSDCSTPEKISDEVVTIDRNAINGTIDKTDGYDVYRIDFTLVQKNEEYTGGGINIYFNIFATQIGGDFEDTEERGYTYYCSTKEDIDRACVEAYPGDIIKLSSDIVYYGDLVFNKPVNLETNDFTLTVNGNLMYDYVLGNGLKVDAGGLGKIIVQCTKEGVGGNFQIKAPISNVNLVGSNASTGDIVVEKNIIIDATNTFSAPGVSFNEVRIVDLKNAKKTIQLESNTRATVSFGTTIGAFQSVVKANNIEIINNGVIGQINLSNMSLLEQTNSPQIYVLNNKDIENPIVLPSWSEKFVEDASGKCTGNTRIIQSFSAGTTEVTGNCDFDNNDVEVERKDLLVEQIEEGNDSRLKIYYQDVDGQTTTIRSILENYLNNEATTGCALNEIVELEIISVGDKAITNSDISFMNSADMLSLRHLDMQRANMYDTSTETYHKLPYRAFYYVSKYESLILPQNLLEIDAYAFYESDIDNIITVPSSVTTFGTNWFGGGRFICFSSSVPSSEAAKGLAADAVFVDEAYVSSYKSVFSKQANRIYPVSVLDENKEHFVRNTKDNAWEITYYIGGNDEVIGENITIDGTTLTITSIYDNAYRHNFNGNSVKFSDTVENLGAYNFYNNKNLLEVDLNNLKQIGENVFSECSALTKVTFGDFLEIIGNNAFYNCLSLCQDVILPDTMQKIGASAFRSTKITSLNTGGTIIVDGFAFAYCSSLIYADLPNVKIIGEDGNNQLFQECRMLVSVNLPSSIKASGKAMFGNCISLRELFMASNDDNIFLGLVPFAGCDAKKLKLYVPEEYIEFYKSKCPGNISSANIYPQGEKMGEELINGYNIGTYIIGDNRDGTCTLITSNVEHSENLVIPEYYNNKPITHIYDNAFRNQIFTNVKLKLGNNVTSIGENAFYQLDGLIKVDFGNSLNTISSSAFAYCSNLAQDIVLPLSMENIGESAFGGSGILSIDTGGTISVASYAFANCKSLVYVKMPEVIVVAEDGNNFVFSKCSSLVSVDLPKVRKVNGSNMFQDCISWSELYLGSDDIGVSIGTLPFVGIPSNSKIKLFVPEALVDFYKERKIVATHQVYPRGEKIGDKAVNGFVVGDYVVLENDSGYTLVTSNLDFEGEVVVPNEYNNKPINEIYPNAFRNQSFTDASIVLGNNVKTIGDRAFYGATGLKSVAMDQVNTIGVEAFYGSGIQVLNGPKLTFIGNNAFRKCASLETVSLPKIETIGSSYVFAECTSLKGVYFENIMTVSTYTFSGDKNLEKITINRLINNNSDNMPATMTIDVSAPCKIYVPYRSLFAYSDTWSGKPVVSFDISATYNGDIYILSDNSGKYALIDFVPGNTAAALNMPETVFADQTRELTIYAISEGAFTTVSESLKALTLSSTIAHLDTTALRECPLLENIYVNANNMYFTSVNGVLYSKDAKMLVKYPVGRSGAFDMTGDEYSSTVGIAANAFADASKLTEIVFPYSLMVIDSAAFTNCTQLNTVEFTGSVPPVLMGVGIFDTTVEDFQMVVPTADGDVTTAYLCAYNFGEYEPFIDLNGNEAPDENTPRNQVSLNNVNAQNTYAILNSSKDDEEEDEELPEDETTGQ